VSQTGKSCFVFVFALRACVRAFVRAKLCEGPRVELSRVSGLPLGRENPGTNPGTNPSGGLGGTLPTPKSSYHACVALWTSSSTK
jgi:hypothetical protein